MQAATCDRPSDGDSSSPLELQLHKQHAMPHMMRVDEARVRIHASCLDEWDIRVRHTRSHNDNENGQQPCSLVAELTGHRCLCCCLCVRQMRNVEFPELCRPPYTPSYACSGVIDALGADCMHFKVGDEVVVLVALDSKHGGCAEFTVQPTINMCQTAATRSAHGTTNNSDSRAAERAHTHADSASVLSLQFSSPLVCLMRALAPCCGRAFKA